MRFVAVLLLGVAVLARPASSSSLNIDASEFQCLALNVYWESRSEPTAGQLAIAHLTLNRVKSNKFAESICGVVQQGGETQSCQFSWWCDGRSDAVVDGPAWREAVRVAKMAIESESKDPTDGALYVHNTSVSPSYLAKKKPTVRIGRHVFYR